MSRFIDMHLTGVEVIQNLLERGDCPSHDSFCVTFLSIYSPLLVSQHVWQRLPLYWRDRRVLHSVSPRSGLGPPPGTPTSPRPDRVWIGDAPPIRTRCGIAPLKSTRWGREVHRHFRPRGIARCNFSFWYSGRLPRRVAVVERVVSSLNIYT